MSIIGLSTRYRVLLMLVVIIVAMFVFGGLSVAFADGGGVGPESCSLPDPSQCDP